MLTQAEVRRYSKGGYIELDSDLGEFFSVLRRAREGWGFGLPRMYSLFRTMEQDESMQIGDNLWAFLGRAVIRQFAVGHEIKQGPYAGRDIYMWNPKVNEDVRGFFEGRLGLLDVCTNFDFKVLFPYPEIKRFDAAKYLSVLERITYWAGPVGLMFLGSPAARGQLNLQLMDLLRVEVTEVERPEMGLWLSEVINAVFRPPLEVEVAWKSTIFRDQRQAIELMKFLVTSGALSYRTALEDSDQDPEQETERKDVEGEWMRDEKKKYRLLPPYDPAHGKRPAAPAGLSEPAGRPVGLRN